MTTTTTTGGYGHAAALAPAATAVIEHMTPLDYLYALGDTVGDVAYTLRQLGVTGRKAKADRCPVANYLRDYAGVERPAVGPGTFIDAAGFVRGMPLAVSQFIRMFDAGGYPDLIAPAVPPVKATS